MISEEKYNNKIKEFLKSATIYGESDLSAQAVMIANYHTKKNEKILKNMKDNNLLEKFLIDIMESDNVYAQNYAATKSLYEGIERLKDKAINILKQNSLLKEEKYKTEVFDIKNFLERILPTLEFK